MKELELIIDKNEEKCQNLISIFETYSKTSYEKNIRKGALLGFYSIVKVIKMKSKENKENNKITPERVELLDKIMEKITIILDDKEKDIIFFASVCMYNIMVSFNFYALAKLNIFFEALLKLVNTTEPKIKEVAERLENTLKSIINYSFQELDKNYDFRSFFKLIIESLRFQYADNRLAISLIICFNQIPNFQLINILHLFLDRLLSLLIAKDSEVKNIANKCLDDFYNEISLNFNEIRIGIKKKILEIIITKIENLETRNNSNEKDIIEIKLKAFEWINLYMKILKKKYSDSKNKSINDKKNEENIDDYFEIFTKILVIIFNIFKNKKEKSVTNALDKDTDDENIAKLNKSINEINNYLLAIIKNPDIKIDIEKQKKFENIITKYLKYGNSNILEPLINWIVTFFEKFKENAFKENYKEFIKNFSYILTYKEEKIYKTAIDAFYQMIKYKESMKESSIINDVIINVLNNLKNQDQESAMNRLKELMDSLIKKIKVEKIYASFAEVLGKMKNSSEFIIKIINILNNYLLTSNNADILRKILKSDDKEFFKKLFKTWSNNSVACLILCLIAEDFELSYNLLKKFDQKNITENSIKEYLQIIKIFESNEFTSKSIYKYKYKYFYI